MNVTLLPKEGDKMWNENNPECWEKWIWKYSCIHTQMIVKLSVLYETNSLYVLNLLHVVFHYIKLRKK